MENRQIKALFSFYTEDTFTGSAHFEVSVIWIGFDKWIDSQQITEIMQIHTDLESVR